MASIPITTTTWFNTLGFGHQLERAGARLYWVGSDTTDLVYYYSEDDGATWTGRTVIHTDEYKAATLVYDAVNGRMNFVYGGGNTDSGALNMRAITSNVVSGTPGALTAETTVAGETGGSGVGVQYPQIVHSATTTNPRYWIIAQKWTSAVLRETRAWFCAAGSAADTGGNWSSTNFTNLGANANAEYSNMGLGVWWTVGGADKVTFLFLDGSSNAFEAVTFDPTAGTPTPGTVVSVGSGWAYLDYNSVGVPVVLAARPDYLVFGGLDDTGGDWWFAKSIDGVNYEWPTPWSSILMGRAALTRTGNDFYLVHNAAEEPIASSASALSFRKITTASDNMGAAQAFSDTSGATITVPRDTGTSKLYAVYRGSVASPYTVRSDTASASQVLRPDADVTTTGWTATPLFSKLNDSSDVSVVTATAA